MEPEDGKVSSPAAPLRRTPLYEAHVACSARIVDYAGWAMPVLYQGILEEARAVRTHVGLFDISHMGRVTVSGEGALDLLQSLTTNDVASLQTHEAQYSLITNPEGGISDDIIVYKQEGNQFLVVINASNAQKDLAWFQEHRTKAVTIIDQTEETAMIAIQGPKAPELIAELAGDPSLLSLPRFHYAPGQLCGRKALLCRTGYTGEDGFEVIVPAPDAADVWTELREHGASACGLGARDALRIEAGYPLYGHEIDEATSPVEAGLMWAVDLQKGPFIGSDQIAQAKANGAQRRLVGLVTTSRNVPRQGYTLLVDDVSVGEITSGVFSPTRNLSIGMGYLTTRHAKSGSQVLIDIRGKRTPATVVPKKNLLKG